MTAVREGVSGGGTNTRRAGRIAPPPAIGDIAAATRVSPARSKASLFQTASCDGKPEPDVEASADMSPASLAHHRPVSPSPYICDKYREPHGGEDAPASVVPSLSALSPACSKVSSSRAAACDATNPKPKPRVEGSAGRNPEALHEISATGGRQGRYRNHEPRDSEVVSSSFASSVDKEERRLSTRIDSAKSSSILENIRLQETCQPSQLKWGGADNGLRDPQISGKKNQVSDHLYWQTDNVSSRISSACDSKLVLANASEGGNGSAQFKKPLAMSPREPIRFHVSRRPVLDRRGALDATSESRLLQVSNKNYMDTLGPGGGYGYPHPPPFYRCEVCREKTAFYWLNCCLKAVCQCCGCACGSAGAVKDKRLQYQREKLPKVKLEGSDLFLWQPCSFPKRQILWMAKRTQNHLQYYFAPIRQFMDPTVDSVEVCVYDFCQRGHDVLSLTKTEKHLARSLLR